MEVKTKYRTKQNDVLISFLEKNEGKHFTVADVSDYLKNEGKPIGITTIYRHLERLVDDGLVKKYVIDAGSPACFEYTGHRDSCRDEKCFHCKCESCGKLIHIHCEELNEIGHHLDAHHGFSLNPLRTVFYGICEDCQ